MTDKSIYTVYTSGISDSDNVILKLIFSVSQRTATRGKSYNLTEDATRAQIIIHSGDNQPQFANNNTQLLIELLNVATTSDKLSYHETSSHKTLPQKTLTRPLIATRILQQLDSYVDETAAHITLETTGGESQNNQNEDIEFSISEEEASVLAVVEDESIANPANQIETHVQPSLPTAPPVQHKAQFNVITLLPKDSVNTNRHGDIDDTPRSLVVDDSASVRKQLELELELFQTKVDFAEDAESAYALLKKHNYDVAFLDVVLPDQDGFQICKHIKSVGKKTKVVMLTGKATPADKVRGSLAGCDAYLVKPVGRMTFQATVEHYLKPAQAMRQALEAGNQR